MTVLKWFAVLVSIGYFGGLGVLFFAQRSLVFPIPQRLRTAPQAAGFPQAEEHFLATADGEKVIVWHVPAKPGHAVVIYFPGNGDFLAGSVGRFRDMTADGTGLVALSYRGYAGSSGEPSESGLLLDADAAYAFTAARYSADRIVVWGFSLGSGVAVALATERPVTKLILEAPLYLDCGRGGLAVSIRAGTLADQGSVSIRRAHSACHGPASDHAWRPRSNNSDPTGRAFVHARP
jgi:uncharacterized protein